MNTISDNMYILHNNKLDDTISVPFDVIKKLVDNNTQIYSNNQCVEYDENEWRILKRFLTQLQTCYDIDDLSSILDDVDTIVVMKYLKYLMKVPNIIIKHNFSQFYHQLMYYEYVYQSRYISFITKLEVAIINDFSRIIEFIDNDILKPLDIPIDHGIDEFVGLYHRIVKTEYQKKIFINFVEMHNQYYDFETHELWTRCQQHNPHITLDKRVELAENGESISSKYFINWMKETNDIKRTLKLSQSILNILENTSMTFNDIHYVLMTDNLEMFKIITKNLDFSYVHPQIMQYLPPKILNYIFNNRNNNIQLPHYNIIINFVNLRGRSKDDYNEAIKILNDNNISYSFECMSIVDRYDEYVEHIYIITYLNTMNIIEHNTNEFINYIDFLSKNIEKFTNHYLDVIITKIAIDNINFASLDIVCSCDDIVDKIINDKNLFFGPDFNEIHDELNNFNVKNLNFIQILCNHRDNYNDNHN